MCLLWIYTRKTASQRTVLSKELGISQSNYIYSILKIKLVDPLLYFEYVALFVSCPGAKTIFLVDLWYTVFITVYFGAKWSFTWLIPLKPSQLLSVSNRELALWTSFKSLIFCRQLIWNEINFHNRFQKNVQFVSYRLKIFSSFCFVFSQLGPLTINGRFVNNVKD